MSWSVGAYSQSQPLLHDECCWTSANASWLAAAALRFPVLPRFMRERESGGREGGREAGRARD